MCIFFFNISLISNFQEIINETLFGTMDKTLYLLEMGFSESQVSWAIEKLGKFFEYQSTSVT